MNVRLLRELCEQCIETQSAQYLSELQGEITRLLDGKRRDLNLAKRSHHRPEQERPFLSVLHHKAA